MIGWALASSTMSTELPLAAVPSAGQRSSLDAAAARASAAGWPGRDVEPLVDRDVVDGRVDELVEQRAGSTAPLAAAFSNACCRKSCWRRCGRGRGAGPHATAVGERLVVAGPGEGERLGAVERVAARRQHLEAGRWCRGPVRRIDRHAADGVDEALEALEVRPRRSGGSGCRSRAGSCCIRTSLPLQKAGVDLVLASFVPGDRHPQVARQRQERRRVFVAGSKRRIMIVSDRCPTDLRASPMAPVSGSSGFAPARLSEPTIR